MAISFIGQATGANSVTLPSHQSGDVILIFAFNETSLTVPSLASGWTSITTNSGNTCAFRLGYLVAGSSSEVSGTWTNATGCIAHVYRGADNADPIGASLRQGSSTSAFGVAYPGLTLEVGDGTAWVAGFAGHRNADTALETPPSGMTNRSDLVDIQEVVGHDTNGGVSSWPTTPGVTVGGTSSGWWSVTTELRQGSPSDLNGSLSATEDADDSAITGDVSVSGSIAAEEGTDDDGSVTGDVLVTGTAPLLDGADSAGFEGEVPNPSIIVTLDVTEGGDGADFFAAVSGDGEPSPGGGVGYGAFDRHAIRRAADKIGRQRDEKKARKKAKKKRRARARDDSADDEPPPNFQPAMDRLQSGIFHAAEPQRIQAEYAMRLAELEAQGGPLVRQMLAEDDDEVAALLAAIM